MKIGIANRPEAIAIHATLRVGVYRFGFSTRFEMESGHEKTAPKLTQMARSRVNKCGWRFFQIGIESCKAAQVALQRCPTLHAGKGIIPDF